MVPTKWNSNISPTSAVTLSGVKTRPPEPAVMTIVLADTATANEARMVRDECMAFYGA